MTRPPARGSRLQRSFFARPTLEVAPALLGCELRWTAESTRIALRIVEVEAYLGVGDDPASHAHRGSTPRNRNMFETPGTLYVYVSYGLHHCLNVVCESEGLAGAVLLRAAEPIDGLELIQHRRKKSGFELTNGPGKLGQALGADLEWNGLDLIDAPQLGLWMGTPPDRVQTTARIGIRHATDLPFRFIDPESPWISRARPSALTRHDLAASVSPSNSNAPE